MKKIYVHNNHHSSNPNNVHYAHRPDMKTALEQAQVDTNSYLSLRINQSILPDNAELLVQIRDKQTGELISVNLNDDSNHLLGKNSRFYGQMMADGNIFNPYIHRRFIAVQFRELVRRFGIYGVREAVSKERDWKYAIEQVCKECHVLANLERHDRLGFEDRRRFFSIDAIIAILSDYVDEVNHVIDCAAAQKDRQAGRKPGQVFIKNYGLIDRNNIRPMKHRFDMLLVNARNCCTYTQLDQLLEKFDFLELDRRIPLPNSFVTPFVNAGAYNALKTAIMFEGKTVDGKDCAGSLRILNSAVNASPNGAMDLYSHVG